VEERWPMEGIIQLHGKKCIVQRYLDLGTHNCQINANVSKEVAPMKRAKYVDLAVYCPDSLNHQRKTSGSSVTLVAKSQATKNPECRHRQCCSNILSPLISIYTSLHYSLVSLSFCHRSKQMRGTMPSRDFPCNQLSVQNSVDIPCPSASA
jgi:hypothetical protein